jgi:alkylhydroperoxidase family enzyme
MGAPKPLSRVQASEELHEIYDKLQKKFGRIPNIFGVMARRPSALKSFLSFYPSVTAEGTVEAKYKELAYLKTSLVNGCEY